MAQLDQIEIHTGKPDFAYKPIRRLEVKCEATNALMPAPTIEEANGRLRALAAKIGANAIIEADYNSGISLTSWKSLKATGLAVVRESEEMACPVCAETIKRAAKRCRFCGHELNTEATAVEPESVVPASEEAPTDHYQEPLRDNNNPAIVLGVVFFGLFVLMLILGSAN